MVLKKCNRCGEEKPVSLTEDSGFFKDLGAKDGFQRTCKICQRELSRLRAARATLSRKGLANGGRTLGKATKPETVEAQKKVVEAARKEAQRERLLSDFAELRPEDFAVGVGNDGRREKNEKGEDAASKEKRQEYSKSMGEFAEAVRAGEGFDAKLGNYIGALAEQERRFSNRRLSRSVSISAAHAELSRELFKQAAKQFFSDKVTPTGYALRTKNYHSKRTAVLLLSDLHFGAELDERGNPLPYRAIEESRRFEYLVRQALDYKPQYRGQSELLVCLNGDIVDGYLKHDERAGLPLTEQKAVFWHHLRLAMGLFAQQYPSVRVECQPGNHGRNIARHPGRATEDKWDGIEWDMYYALSQMCSGLPNVSFSIPFRAVSAVDLYGKKLLLTHGDTEPGFGDPDTRSEANAALCAQINSTRQYGHEFAAVAVGHWHKARDQSSRYPRMIFNGALVPPNGFARSHGLIGERQGQYLWEAVEGYPVGDVRFIEVGPSQDKDEKLGSLIPPFRFPRPEKK